jgi:hypothetical protein
MGIFRKPAATEQIAEPEPEATSMAQIAVRQPVTVRGTVTRIRSVPRTGLPSLAVTVEDESGRVTAIWSGRRAIGGISLGRHLDLSGIAVQGASGLEFHNPVYTLRER